MDAQGALDKLKKIRDTDRDEYLLDKSKGTITSTLIGGALGLMVAYNRKGNLLVGAILGGAIAGIITTVFINRD